MNMDIIIKGKTIGIDFDIDNISIGNDGIGSYEFCGAKGFDRGNDYIEDFDIINLEVYSERLNKHVIPSNILKKAILVILYDKYVEYITESYVDKIPTKEDYDDYIADLKYNMSREECI